MQSFFSTFLKPQESTGNEPDGASDSEAESEAGSIVSLETKKVLAGGDELRHYEAPKPWTIRKPAYDKPLPTPKTTPRMATEEVVGRASPAPALQSRRESVVDEAGSSEPLSYEVTAPVDMELPESPESDLEEVALHPAETEKSFDAAGISGAEKPLEEYGIHSVVEMSTEEAGIPSVENSMKAADAHNSKNRVEQVSPVSVSLEQSPGVKAVEFLETRVPDTHFAEEIDLESGLQQPLPAAESASEKAMSFYESRVADAHYPKEQAIATMAAQGGLEMGRVKTETLGEAEQLNDKDDAGQEIGQVHEQDEVALRAEVYITDEADISGEADIADGAVIDDGANVDDEAHIHEEHDDVEAGQAREKDGVDAHDGAGFFEGVGSRDGVDIHESITFSDESRDGTEFQSETLLVHDASRGDIHEESQLGAEQLYVDDDAERGRLHENDETDGYELHATEGADLGIFHAAGVNEENRKGESSFEESGLHPEQYELDSVDQAWLHGDGASEESLEPAYGVLPSGVVAVTAPLEDEAQEATFEDSEVRRASSVAAESANSEYGQEQAGFEGADRDAAGYFSLGDVEWKPQQSRQRRSSAPTEDTLGGSKDEEGSRRLSSPQLHSELQPASVDSLSLALAEAGEIPADKTNAKQLTVTTEAQEAGVTPLVGSSQETAEEQTLVTPLVGASAEESERAEEQTLVTSGALGITARMTLAGASVGVLMKAASEIKVIDAEQARDAGYRADFDRVLSELEHRIPVFDEDHPEAGINFNRVLGEIRLKVPLYDPSPLELAAGKKRSSVDAAMPSCEDGELVESSKKTAKTAPLTTVSLEEIVVHGSPRPEQQATGKHELSEPNRIKEGAGSVQETMHIDGGLDDAGRRDHEGAEPVETTAGTQGDESDQNAETAVVEEASGLDVMKTGAAVANGMDEPADDSEDFRGDAQVNEAGQASEKLTRSQRRKLARKEKARQRALASEATEPGQESTEKEGDESKASAGLESTRLTKDRKSVEMEGQTFTASASQESSEQTTESSCLADKNMASKATDTELTPARDGDGTVAQKGKEEAQNGGKSIQKDEGQFVKPTVVIATGKAKKKGKKKEVESQKQAEDISAQASSGQHGDINATPAEVTRILDSKEQSKQPSHGMKGWAEQRYDQWLKESTSELKPQARSAAVTAAEAKLADLDLSKYEQSTSIAIIQVTNDALTAIDVSRGMKGDFDPHGRSYDWPFWSRLVETIRQNPYGDEVQALKPSVIEHIVNKRYAGVPSEARKVVWLHLSDNHTPNSVLNASEGQQDQRPLSYLVSDQVLVDVNRTFPSEGNYSSEKQKLSGILQAYAKDDPMVGYCSAIALVAGVLALELDKQEASTLLKRLMFHYDLRRHYLRGLEGTRLRNYQFEKLLERFRPELAQHLQEIGCPTESIVGRWFSTCFAYRCPLDLVNQVYDLLIIEGNPALFKMALAVFAENEKELMSARNPAECLDFFANHTFDVHGTDYKQWICVAGGFDISQEYLEDLAASFHAIARQSQVLGASESLASCHTENQVLAAQIHQLTVRLDAMMIDRERLIRDGADDKLRIMSLVEENYRLSAALYEERAERARDMAVAEMETQHLVALFKNRIDRLEEKQ